MRLILKVLCLFGILPAVLSAAADTVTVTDHTIIGIKSSPAAAEPETIVIKLEVEYLLKSKPNAILLFVVDRETEMNFTLADQKEVMSEKKKKKIEVTARLNGFSRDTLRGIILLQDPDAPVGSTPLAKTGVSLDVKKFKKG